VIYTTYLCGGINNLSDAECNDWRDIATAKLRTKVLNPMVRDCRGKENNIDPSWLVTADVEDIEKSHFVLVNATKPSWGTAMEVVYAYNASMFIVAFVGDPLTRDPLSPWLRHHCDLIVPTLEGAIDVINGKIL